MKSFEIVKNGHSRSFTERDPFLGRASDSAEILIVLGKSGPIAEDPSRIAILVELDTECLGVHTGERSAVEGSNILGFARYRNGNDAPTNLIELVRQPYSSPEALEEARLVFEGAGFDVVICADRPGRIIDRLVRPKYNDALRFLDDGLASAEAMDMTCRMGLGYPDGLIERSERGDLARHFEISRAIHELTGQQAYAPARRAVVAMQRKAAS